MQETQGNSPQGASQGNNTQGFIDNLSAKNVAKYTLLPGILPRLYRLSQHFSQFLFMFTQIFGSVGLIPRDHPCLMAENIGRYRFTDILGLAASNVVFDRKHLPQAIMFFAVILSMTLLVAIILGLAASTVLNVSSAHAQLFGTPTSISGVTYSASTDWAMNFLYRIFGETGVIPAPPPGAGLGNPWFMAMLVTMLKYYSLAMLSVGAFMILYILIITVTESARTGEPFSSRFDGVWAPIRLALAIGLLMPVMSSGYNGAQIIALQTAVWGSNLATNVWYAGLSTVSKDQKFFASMASDPGYRFVRDMFLVNLCVEGLNKQKEIGQWELGDIEPVVTYNVNGHIIFKFGSEDAPDFCGTVDVLAEPVAPTPTGITGEAWTHKIVKSYREIAKDFLPITNMDASFLHMEGIVKELNTVLPQGATDPPEMKIKSSTKMGGVAKYAADTLMGKEDPNPDAKSQYFGPVVSKEFPTSEKVVGWMKDYWKHMGVTSYTCIATISKPCPYPEERGNYFSTATYTNSITQYNKWIIDRMLKDAEHGWTTAGVFYLRISAALASIGEVVNNPPVVTSLPVSFSKIFALPANASATVEAVEAECSATWYNPLTWFGNSDCEEKYKKAKAMYGFLHGGKDWFHSSVENDPKAYHLVETTNFSRALEVSEPDSPSGQQPSNVTGPVFSGFFADILRVKTNDLNPLGALIQWGNMMMTASFLAFGLAFAAQGSSYADLALSLATLLLISGFTLTFWVPTLPFMHFTFAVIEWMISVLEAVIGMPLWALSMITLQGDGLGKNGMDGVKRLFEIMLRPTIIILAFVSSIIIFTAGVGFFNSAIAIYSDASSASGNVLTSVVAGPAMLFLYCFGVYSLATSSFKLVDDIPDRFGRWMGLEGGFGSNIKAGVSDVSKLVVGGVIFKAINDKAAAKVGEQKENRKNEAAAAALKNANKGGPSP